MTTTYLAGHGEWSLANGYTAVPKGCSISFYTEAHKNMFTADMKAVIGGTYGGSVQLKVDEYKSCPNYTLHADPVSHQACKALLLGSNQPGLSLVMFSAGGPFTLAQIFDAFSKKQLATDFVWCACRYTILKDVGGKAIGVNGAQGSFGNRNNLGQLVLGGNDNFYFNPTGHVVKNL